MNKLTFLPFACTLLWPVFSAAQRVEIIAGLPVTQRLSEPFSIVIDHAGSLYGVEFTKSNRVFKLEHGQLSFIAGAPHTAGDEKNGPEEVVDGPDAQKAVFKGMHDLALTKRNQLILADTFHNRLRLLDLASGSVKTLAGTGATGFAGDHGPAANAQFNIAMTASLSPDESQVLVADIGNHRVRAIDLTHGTVQTLAGDGQRGKLTDGAAALQAPLADARAVTMAADGTLYIVLRGGNSLVEIKQGHARTVVNTAGKKGSTGDGGLGREATLNGPKYVTMDPQGRVLILDTENHCVRRYIPKTGKIELVAGTPGQAGDQLGETWTQTALKRPHGARIGPDGKLYVADSENNRVLAGPYPP